MKTKQGKRVNWLLSFEAHKTINDYIAYYYGLHNVMLTKPEAVEAILQSAKWKV